MQVVPVEEEPAPVSGVVVGVVTEQPGGGSFGGAARGGLVDQTLAMLDGLTDEGRGSLEFLGRWNDKRDDPAMPIKLEAGRDTETMVRGALCKLVDELVQTNASSGTLAISFWTLISNHDEYAAPISYSYGVVSWSASPDDTSYQRHGALDEAGRLKAQLAAVEAKKRGQRKIRFADFEGVIDDEGVEDQIAVYRVTLPSRGLDPDKWVGRPPPPAPEDIYTGPRRDGLLSTEEISGEYFAPGCFVGDICNSMTVVPHGPDTIETWRTGCLFCPCPPLPAIGPIAEGEVRTRNPGTNAFRNPQNPYPNNVMTFSARGTISGGYKKRPGSQKRAFQKVDARDLAGKWCGCGCMVLVPFWWLSHIFCTKKKALNQDQYEYESGLCCCLCRPCSVSGTRTRKYVNGHPTNGFANGDIYWYHDPGCAATGAFFAKKVG